MAQEIPIKIKKYANRRLYNMATSTYITLDELSLLLKQGKEFVVHDAKTNEDLTRQVLTQIIIEKETTGQSLLPLNFLKNIIRNYDNKMGSNLTSYLDTMMTAFMEKQAPFNKSLQSFFPLMDVKKNTAFFENMFGLAPSKNSDAKNEIEALREEVASLQEKIDQLTKKSS